jgi:hypothetical protein
MLRWSEKGSGLIDAYYFQLYAKGSIAYITPISPGKWDHWREDWMIIHADIHDCLVLSTESPTAKRSDWEETPKLHRAYVPMIERIKHLMSHGLMTMMMLHDFLSRCITPLQDHARLTRLYPGEGDTTRPGFRFGPGHAGRLAGEAEPRPIFHRLCHSSGGLRTHVLEPGNTDEAVKGSAHAGQYRHQSASEGRRVPRHPDP